MRPAGRRDAGMPGDDIIQFLGEHLESGDDHHVLEPANDIKIAVRIHPGNVAGMHPAVSQRMSRFLGFIEISLHDLSAPDQYFARLSDFDRQPGIRVHQPKFRIRKRQPEGAGILDAVTGVTAGHRRCLCHTVELNEISLADDRLELMNVFGRKWRNRAQAPFDRAQVHPAELRIFHEIGNTP